MVTRKSPWRCSNKYVINATFVHSGKILQVVLLGNNSALCLGKWTKWNMAGLFYLFCNLILSVQQQLKFSVCLGFLITKFITDLLMGDWMYRPVSLLPRGGIRAAPAGSTAHTLRLWRRSRGSPSTQVVTVFGFWKNRTRLMSRYLYAVLKGLFLIATAGSSSWTFFDLQKKSTWGLATQRKLLGNDLNIWGPNWRDGTVGELSRIAQLKNDPHISHLTGNSGCLFSFLSFKL